MSLRNLALVAALAAVAAPSAAQEVVSRDLAGDPLAGGPCRFVPAAGRTLSDTFDRYWVTDLDLTNLGTEPATVQIAVLARGETNTTAPTAVLAPLAPGASIRLDDVVGLVLERVWRPFLGGFAMCSEGGAVLAVSRTSWHTATGAVGQAMPAMSVADMVPAGTTAHLLGLREDAVARTHLGVFNPSPFRVQVRIRLVDDGGRLVITLFYEVPALSQLQLNRVLEPGRAEVSCEDGPVMPYATRVDNLSNDSAFVVPQEVASDTD